MDDIKIGDKVVFIDDINWTNSKGVQLIYRKEYTVLDILVCECGQTSYDLGGRLLDENSRMRCGCGRLKVGIGIHWAKSERFLPYIITFKDFTRKLVIENIHKDILSFVQNKEYEKAVETIKRLEKISNEL